MRGSDMGSGTNQGFVVNLFAFGTIMIAIGKAWDLLGQTVNTMIANGWMTQDGANTFSLLSIIFYSLGFLFLIAGGYNVIVESKRDSDRGV